MEIEFIVAGFVCFIIGGLVGALAMAICILAKRARKGEE